MKKAFDDAKYRRVAKDPVLEIHAASMTDPSCAPVGDSTLSVLVHFVPYDLEGGWTDPARSDLGDKVVAVLENHLPGISQKIKAKQVLAPPDMEERFGAKQGHIHHGEHALDQLIFRPVPECAQYTTPIDGLFLGASGSHPGGGLTCAPGFLAAGAMLK